MTSGAWEMTERHGTHRETAPLSMDLCRLPRMIASPVAFSVHSDRTKRVEMDRAACRTSLENNNHLDERIHNLYATGETRVRTSLASVTQDSPFLERFPKHVSNTCIKGLPVNTIPLQRIHCSSSIKSDMCLDYPKNKDMTNDPRTEAPKSPSPNQIRRPSRCCAPSRSSPMRLFAILLAILMTSVVLLPQAVLADWDSNCPANCKCTYSNNRKVAKCENAGYSTVPSLLSAEIQELVLSNNNILQIDKEEFQKAGLVNLQRLDLSNNKITYVDKDAFSGLKILIELDLNNNMVDKLHPLTFTGMEKLRKLDLSGNELTRLEADQFPTLLHLQRLKLSNCNIRYVHNYAFRNLPNITAIDLSNNALESVQSALFSQSPRLVSLELANNRWNCDCLLRPFARWMAETEFFKNTNWNCFSPDRLKDAHWRDVPLEDFACEPTVEVSMEIVSVSVGSHSALDCWATGDPIPTLQWVADKRVLSNLTQIGDSTDHYVVYAEQNETGVFSTLELGIYGDHHPTEYTCVAKNPANNVEKTIRVVVGSDAALDITENSGPSMIILISIGVSLIVLVILLIILIVCCWCRRRPATMTPLNKLNGSAGEHGSVMVVAPGNSINPIGKPPRQYEKLPQKDVEMTHIVNPLMESGGHRSFEDVNYPIGGNPSSNYGDQRARLPPLEEEGGMSTHHPASPCLVNYAAPSPTLTLQSNLTQTTTSHYPDLLDNARVPRTISPTQMSYQSLAYPPLSHHDWRFSYAHPGTDYSSTGAPSEYARSPVAYSTPQHQRPGYVTLPRRPRAPSWSGVPSPNPHIGANTLLSPSAPPRETVYDTLGPRTTADGTSTTDLTRPGSRAALYEPFPPAGGIQAPTSPLGLAAHYNSMAAQKYNSPRHLLGQAKPGTSQTLPRSTPNLLDDYSIAIPQYRAVRKPQKADPYLINSEIEPLIEDPHLGIPYDPNYQFHPVNVADSVAPEMVNGEYAPNEKQRTNNNNNSKNNYNNVKAKNGNMNKSQGQRQSDTLNRNMRSASPAMSPSGKSSNRILNSSLAPSPVPTPTQILSSASPHTEQTGLRPSPACTPNNNLPSSRSETPPGLINGGYPTSPTSPSSTGPGSPCTLPLVSPSPSSSSSTTANSTINKKKIPPRPPPKPLNKRLSVASVNSDSSGAVLCRKASVASGGGLYQDEGPDGSEV